MRYRVKAGGPTNPPKRCHDFDRLPLYQKPAASPDSGRLQLYNLPHRPTPGSDIRDIDVQRSPCLLKMSRLTNEGESGSSWGVSAFKDRGRLRAGIDYVLRLMRFYTELVGGDPTRALVFIAAAQASTQHINPKAVPLIDETFVRDDLRRAISVSALARSLGLSIETTRRHVMALVDLGLARRTKDGGVLVTSRELDSEAVRAAVIANNVNVARLLADIHGYD